MTISSIPSSPPVIASRTLPAKTNQRTLVPEKPISTKESFTQREPHPPLAPPESQASKVLSLDSVNEFFYGYRFVQTCKNGTETWERVPLTLKDLLFPQLDDKVGQSVGHANVGYVLYAILRNYLEKIPGVFVLWDVIMRWGIRGQRDFVPDILVLMDVWHPRISPKAIYDRGKYGGIPVLAIELTSKSTRYIDVNTDTIEDSKYVEYEYIGVTYYVVIDLARQPEHAPPPFWGYHLVGKKYQPLIPDQHGRLWLERLGVSLGEYGEQLAWFDADGNRLLSFAEQEELAQQEKARADQAEERIRELEAALRQRDG